MNNVRSVYKFAALIALVAVPIVTAQEVSVSDFFDSTSTVSSEQPLIGVSPQGFLRNFRLLSSGEKDTTPYFTLRSFNLTAGLEQKETRYSGYDLDIERGEVRVDLKHGDVFSGTSAFSISPSFSYLWTDGQNLAGTKRTGRTSSPSLSFSFAPKKLSLKKEDYKREIAMSVLLIDQKVATDDLTTAGALTQNRTRSTSVSPSLDYTLSFKVAGNSNMHEFKTSAIYTYRRGKDSSPGVLFPRSTSSSGSITTNTKFVLNPVWALTIGLNYDFPIHEKPAVGKAPMGDAVIGSNLKVARKFGEKGANQITFEYRQIHQDRSYNIARYSVGLKVPL